MKREFFMFNDEPGLSSSSSSFSYHGNYEPEDYQDDLSKNEPLSNHHQYHDKESNSTSAFMSARDETLKFNPIFQETQYL